MPSKPKAQPTAAAKKPINSRQKGVRAERELKNMLKEAFPEYAEAFKRNQDQNAFGGHDIDGLPGYSVECKAVAEFSLPPFWRQTCEQAEKADMSTPVLFRKVPLRGWQVYLPLSHIRPDLASIAPTANADYAVRMSFEAFVLYVRYTHKLGALKAA
jgi:hypothetical protein